ncbi:MAG TPA: hypothetical protein VIG24_03605 [Acidimicrobiia bacterium]
MTFRVMAPWGGWRVGAILTREELAGCNMTMLVGRGVLQPVQRKTKKAPARPVETADEPEEQ